MQIHIGLDSFKEVINNLEHGENKEKAWMNYYKEFKIVFDTIFSKLYMSDLDSINIDLIPHIDFCFHAQHAELSLKAISLNNLEKILKRCRDYFNFTNEFDVYLLVGFGHIDGTAFPEPRPFLYLGLERLLDVDIEQLIQHEFNHLVRFKSLLKSDESEKMTLGDLVIAEGLATLTPLVMNEMEFSQSNLQKMLFLEDPQFNNLKQNAFLIEQDIRADFENLLNPTLMAKYFMLNENSNFGKSGYFVGMQIILTLLNKGWDLRDLTILDTKKIWNEYHKILNW